MKKKVDCADCTWLRRAPYEARKTGCYLPSNMVSKQSAPYLDEQQIPGDHRKINLRGDCPDFQPKPRKRPLWQRLLAVGP